VFWGEQPPFTPSVCGAVIFVSEIGCVRPAISEPTEWKRIGNQIDAAMIFARADFGKRAWNPQRVWLERLVS
jgi:hypothetical protein